LQYTIPLQEQEPLNETIRPDEQYQSRRHAVARKPLPTQLKQNQHDSGTPSDSVTSPHSSGPRPQPPTLPPRSQAATTITKPTPPTLPPRLAHSINQTQDNTYAQSSAHPVYGLGISNGEYSIRPQDRTGAALPMVDDDSWCTYSEFQSPHAPRPPGNSGDHVRSQSETTLATNHCAISERPDGGMNGKNLKLAKIEIWGTGTLMLDMIVAMNVKMFLKSYRTKGLS